MYPEHSQNGKVNVSRFRSTTMCELISYMDLPTQLNLKQVNRYFRKLITISHCDVSLSTRTGWVDVIHLSSFLKRIRLYGEPRERDLKEFTQMIENDSFIELSTLELYHIGEWALLEILEALSKRVQRALRIGILDNNIEANLVIRETDFSPYFASRFSQLMNLSLYRILTGLRLIVQGIEGIETIIKETEFYKCSRLVSLDLSSIPLLRHGFENLSRSIWSVHDNERGDVPRLTTLNLQNTGLTDNCVLTLVDVINRGYLSNLMELNVSANRLSRTAAECLTEVASQYLLPNLRALILSDNTAIGGGGLGPFFEHLSQGVCPVIEVLKLNHCGLNPDDMKELNSFLLTPFAENLHVIDLGNNCEITTMLSQFFKSLRESSCKGLKLLNLEGVNMGKESLSQMTAWLQYGSLSNLHSFYLNNNCLDQYCFCVLLKYLHHSSIQEMNVLDVSSNLIGDFNLKNWEHLIYKRASHKLCVHNIDFSHNPLTNEDMKCISEFMQYHTQMAMIHEADFEDNIISAKGIGVFLSTFPVDEPCQLSRLSVVSLSLRTIGRELNLWLCSPASSNLRRLVLMNCNLCKMDLTYLINAFEISKYCQKLQVLKLSGNYEIEDGFVTDFIRIYSIDGILPMLYELDLMYTSVTKVGAYAFLDFFNKVDVYSLRRLNLAYTKLSEHRIGILFPEFKRCFKGGVML